MSHRINYPTFDAELAQSSFDDSERTRIKRLSRLANVFYQRLAHRRINSIATYHDPSLREFFQKPESFT